MSGHVWYAIVWRWKIGEGGGRENTECLFTMIGKKIASHTTFEHHNQPCAHEKY